MGIIVKILLHQPEVRVNIWHITLLALTDYIYAITQTL